MDDAERPARRIERVVRVVERIEHVARDKCRDVGLQANLGARAFPEQREHVEAVDVLHRDVRRVGVGPQLEDLDDVAVSSCAVIRASSMNISTNDLSVARCGKIFLIATSFSKP